MQVFFERLIIPRFRMIAAASPGTVLEDLCNRLTVDDGIHHSSGVAYERVLLEDASREAAQQLVKVANRMLPIFVDHSLWRPKARASIAGLMRERDIQMLHDDLEQGVRLAGVARDRRLGSRAAVVRVAAVRLPRKNDAKSIRARQEALAIDGLVTSIDLEPFAGAAEAVTGVGGDPGLGRAADDRARHLRARRPTAPCVRPIAESRPFTCRSPTRKAG